MSTLFDLGRDLMTLQAKGAAEGPPMSPAERAAASEAIKRRDREIEKLRRAAMTCPSCGAILVCPMCGHDEHDPHREGVSHRLVGPGEVEEIKCDCAECQAERKARPIPF